MIKLIKNVQIYAPDDIGVKDILIIGEKIVAIDENIQLLQKAEVIDGENLIITPGFIDQHVHITGGGGEGGFTSRVPEIQLSEITQSGITTVVGLLGTDVYTRSIENLLSKTKALNEEGITAYCLTGGYRYPPVSLTDTIEKDLLFINEIIGLKLAISDHRSSQIGYDELKRLASQVRLSTMMANKQGYIHLHLGRDQTSLDHVFDLVEKTSLPIQLFKPTHVNKIYKDALKFAELGGTIDFTASLRDEAFNQLKQALEIVPRGQITLSSDSNGSLPKWNDQKELIGMDVSRTDNLLKTVKRLIQTGSSIEKALALVTESVAKSIGQYPRKGVIKANSDADFAIFTKDFELVHVLAKGQFMIKDQVPLSYGTFERS